MYIRQSTPDAGLNFVCTMCIHETVDARQSTLDTGLDFWAQVLETFQVVPSSLESRIWLEQGAPPPPLLDPRSRRGGKIQKALPRS